MRPDGTELEFDLPKSLSVEERAGNWQFPARVYRPNHGPAVLLNGKEMEARVDGWLKRGQMTRAVCGHWIFTWNAFKIECDPQSVMETINRIDLNSSEIRDGMAYNDPDASQPALLRRASTAVGGATFSVEMKIDPEKVRRERAETDAIVAEMSRRVLTKADALKARAKDDISGDISIAFLADRTGTIVRRAKVTRLQIREGDGKLGKEVISETITRRPLPHGSK